MYNRILVAVDGSESSLSALQASFPLVRAEKGVVIVVSVVPPYDGELRLVGVKNVAATVRGPYEKALAESERLARDAGVRFYTLLAEGEPHEEIVDVAEAEGCGLIVVGVRGFNPAQTVVMGSMTARIIGYSYTNVLVVPRAARFRWDNILVALDGSTLGRSALRIASYFQGSYGSRATILSVADVPFHVYGVDPTVVEGFIATARKVLDDAMTEATAMGLSAQAVIKEGDPAEIITDVSKQAQADLVLMGSHGRTGLRRLLMGSVTERVLGHVACPVMVVRA
jgi:nucleotide-binding universal stress UspA family protein